MRDFGVLVLALVANISATACNWMKTTARWVKHEDVRGLCLGSMVAIQALTAVIFRPAEHLCRGSGVKGNSAHRPLADAVAARRGTGTIDPVLVQFWHYLVELPRKIWASLRTRHAAVRPRVVRARNLWSWCSPPALIAVIARGAAGVQHDRNGVAPMCFGPCCSPVPRRRFLLRHPPVSSSSIGNAPAGTANGRIAVSNPPTGLTGMLTIDVRFSRFDVSWPTPRTISSRRAFRHRVSARPPRSAASCAAASSWPIVD